MKDLLTLSLLAIFLAGPAVGSEDPKAKLPVRAALTVTASQDTVKVGGELKVKIVERNISNGQGMTEWDPSPDAPDFRILVRDAQGALAPLTKHGQELYGHGPPVSKTHYPFRFLNPGEETPGEEADVSKIYDLTKPGTYTIQAISRYFFGDPKNAYVKSNIVTVTVTQ
jgi:hypothetical protein